MSDFAYYTKASAIGRVRALWEAGERKVRNDRKKATRAAKARRVASELFGAGADCGTIIATLETLRRGVRGVRAARLAKEKAVRG